MSQKTIQISFFIGLTLGLLVLSFFVFKSYLSIIFLSALLAVVFYPLYQKLLVKFNGRRNLASISTVIVVSVFIIIPIVLLSLSLLKESISLYNSLAFGGADKFIMQVNLILNHFGAIFSEDTTPYLTVDAYVRDLLNWIIGHFDSVFAIIFGSLFNFILMILSLYYLLIFGEKIKRNLILWSPLPDIYDENIISVLRSSIESMVRGRFLVAAAQGLFLGLGFAIFGISSPVLWGFVGALASFIPIIGTSLITIPAVGYLFVNGHIGVGVGLLLWGALAVGLVDNVFSYFFLKDKINVHPLIVLFSILGGVEFLGPIGFLVGPIVVGTLFAFMRIYPFIMFYKGGQPSEDGEI